jgi:hypothetical protein
MLDFDARLDYYDLKIKKFGVIPFKHYSDSE